LQAPVPTQIKLCLYHSSQGKRICFVYKSTPIKNGKGKLLGIIRNIFDKGCTSAIVKIDSDEIGSCFALQNFDNVTKEFHPEIPFTVNIVKETDWEKQQRRSPSLLSLPMSLFHLAKKLSQPLSMMIFLSKCKKSAHGFWAKMMSDVLNQTAT
jgi:hypothetical protein